MHKDEGGRWEDMAASSGEGTDWKRDFLTPRQAKTVPNDFCFKGKSPEDCRVMMATALPVRRCARSLLLYNRHVLA